MPFVMPALGMGEVINTDRVVAIRKSDAGWQIEFRSDTRVDYWSFTNDYERDETYTTLMRAIGALSITDRSATPY